jgi:hypothetical protein
MRRVRGLAAVAVVVVLTGSASRSSDPITTIARVRGGIYALAQDGDRIAWVDCRGPVLWQRGHTTRLGRHEPCDNSPSWIALAGTRVLWARDHGGNNREISLSSASSAQPRGRRVAQVDLDAGLDGSYFGGVSGSGSTLAYTSVRISRDDASGIGLDADCFARAVVCRYVLGRGTTAVLTPGHVSDRAYGGVAVAVRDGLIAVARAGGKTTIEGAVTGPCACAYTPAWSPDGRSIALAGGWTSSGTSLYVAAADGSSLRRLTNQSGVIDAHPTWSPDGTEIAFHRASLPIEADAVPDVYVVPSAGGQPRLLVSGSDPAWSPDGREIAFARTKSGIYTIPASGGAPHRVARGIGAFASPTWSPDGSSIAFVEQGRIYVASAAGGGQPRLVGTATTVGGVAWSPDGARLALWNDGGIRVVDLASMKSRVLGAGLYPSWAPDGRLVYSERFGTAIRVVAADGTVLTRIPAPQPVRPAIPIEVRRAQDGRLFASFEPDGDVQSLALSRAYAAVVVRAGKSAYRLDVYALPRGHLVQTLALAPVEFPARDFVSVAGALVAFNDGRRIRLLNARTGTRSTIALARSMPVGVSIAGQRLAWAERGGLVRAVSVSAQRSETCRSPGPPMACH